MKTALILIAVTILLFAGGAAYDLYLEKPPPSVFVAETRADPAQWEETPGFHVTDLRGDLIDIKELRGMPVILSFWATWCTTCVIEFPPMLDYARRNQERVVLIALSSDEGEGAVRGFLDKLETSVRDVPDQGNVHIALDANRHVTRDIFLTTMYPETIFITADGKMAYKTVGMTDWGRMPDATPDWSGGIAEMQVHDLQ